jgi:hypothetical protein
MRHSWTVYFTELVMRLRLFSFGVLLLLLGCGAVEDPQRLLAIASNYAVPGTEAHPVEPTDQARLEALRTLLGLQRKTFGVTLAPIKYKDTTGIDHVFIKTLRSSNNSITLLVTPSRLADQEAAEGAYWSMEELTFEKSGKLLSRKSHKD